eukprot:Sdes_comp18257_c0_seq1m7884
MKREQVISFSCLMISLGICYASFSPISVSLLFSCIAMHFCMLFIPKTKSLFLDGGLYGIDLNKPTYEAGNDSHNSKYRVAESMGLIIGVVYLVVMFFFIPIPFLFHGYLSNRFEAFSGPSWLLEARHWIDLSSDFLPRFSSPDNRNANLDDSFPHHKFVEFMSALLSVCCMLLLGFADDVLNLKWRHKLLLPTFASLPLLMVYFVNSGVTYVTVPFVLKPLLGDIVDLGIFYYVYMGMLAVFLTNAINILAGVNGLEVGQSVVIGVSILVNDVIQIKGGYDFSRDNHLFSMYFMFPFVACSLALLYFNWYPSSVFVGDTYCYFAGMTFAVVAITGHFSKTMLLFFLPQILNFLYSTPQLFRLIPCPRHRLPSLNRSLNLLQMSVHRFPASQLSFSGRWVVFILDFFHLVHIEWFLPKGKVPSKWIPFERPKNTRISTLLASHPDLWIQMNNLTIINFALKLLGPLHEKRLCVVLLVFQSVCSIFALIFRYQFAKLFFHKVE